MTDSALLEQAGQVATGPISNLWNVDDELRFRQDRTPFT